MDEQLLNNIENNLEDIPEEVREFIFGEDFKMVNQELAAHVVDITQQLELQNNLQLFLLGGMTFDSFLESISALSVSEDEKIKIKTIIQEKVLDEIKLALEVTDDFEKNNSSDTNKIDRSSAPTPSDILTRLNQTMTAPSTLAPTKRSYGENTPLNTTSAPSTAPSGIKSIDPYREIPEK